MGGCSAGWQGAAAVTPRGAAVLHKEGGKGKQMLTIRSFLLSLVSERKEAKCTYLGNLLDFGDKLEKRVRARSADRILPESR